MSVGVIRAPMGHAMGYPARRAGIPIEASRLLAVATSAPDPDPTDGESKELGSAPVTPGPLAGETIWYEDPARKQVHRDLVVAGMERARQQGKRIGRPRVSERPEFEQLYTRVLELLGSGGLSRRQAARELGIGYATLKRLLDSCGRS